ncbi:uncharacterized protein LOC107364239 [Tetranychus urticae]|uniref:uncharacterized protein LOC107364239 n=1 Tax=Tetranychus urticae TaxID=32264 RepID=UPI00077BAB02|nr:uncharacterized protein LOC107364239 [Tetranychus urticae]
MDFVDLNQFVHGESCLTDHLTMDYTDQATSLPFHSESTVNVFSYNDDTLRSYLDDSSRNHSTDNRVHNDPLLSCVSNSETHNQQSIQQETLSCISSDWIGIFSDSLTVDLIGSPSTDLFNFAFPLEAPSTSTCESYDEIETNEPFENDCYDLQSPVSKTASDKFKKILSLNVDNSKLKEPWIPSVGKKILATYYSPLNIKSEFLSNRIILDEFESLAVKEAVNAFHNIASSNVTISLRNQVKPDPRPTEFVGTCEKVRAYRKLHAEDKITLLSNVFFDINAMKGIITYDHRTDSFNCSGARLDRVDVFHSNPEAHDGLKHVIETFPDRWRNDLKAIALIYLIVIFNPDLPNLKYVDVVRLEQYSYIYLLGRYLESVCESPSDASDNLYRLMVKIDEIQKLRNNIVNLFEAFKTGASSLLKNIITKLIQSSMR